MSSSEHRALQSNDALVTNELANTSHLLPAEWVPPGTTHSGRATAQRVGDQDYTQYTTGAGGQFGDGTQSTTGTGTQVGDGTQYTNGGTQYTDGRQYTNGSTQFGDGTQYTNGGTQYTDGTQYTNGGTQYTDGTQYTNGGTQYTDGTQYTNGGTQYTDGTQYTNGGTQYTDGTQYTNGGTQYTDGTQYMPGNQQSADNTQYGNGVIVPNNSGIVDGNGQFIPSESNMPTNPNSPYSNPSVIPPNMDSQTGPQTQVPTDAQQGGYVSTNPMYNGGLDQQQQQTGPAPNPAGADSGTATTTTSSDSSKSGSGFLWGADRILSAGATGLAGMKAISTFEPYLAGSGVVPSWSTLKSIPKEDWLKAGGTELGKSLMGSWLGTTALDMTLLKDRSTSPLTLAVDVATPFLLTRFAPELGIAKTIGLSALAHGAEKMLFEHKKES